MTDKLQWITWFATLLRKVHLRKAISAVKKHATFDLTAVLHQDAIHRMRQLSAAGVDRNRESGANAAIEVSTACCKVMGDLLELSPHEVHCCLKVFCPGSSYASKNDCVVTLARSEPFDERGVDEKENNKHLVESSNTVWSALLGKFDGKTSWPTFKCFSCGDLWTHEKIFECSRENWENYYRSTLVFPVRYMTDPTKRERVVSGFLAFDSLKCNAFGSLPDVFSFRENPSDYHGQIAKHTPYHLGAILADTLGVFFKPWTD